MQIIKILVDEEAVERLSKLLDPDSLGIQVVPLIMRQGELIPVVIEFELERLDLSLLSE